MLTALSSRADRTVSSLAGLRVRKLAGSIPALMTVWPSGSTTSTVPPRIAKLPLTGASPNRCRVLNETCDVLVSMV